MLNIILFDLSVITARKPVTSEGRQAFALNGLNISIPWPLEGAAILDDCVKRAVVPMSALNDWEYMIWSAYLPLSYTMDQFVSGLHRRSKKKEYLPLEIILQYKSALILGAFTELRLWVSKEVGDGLLIGKRSMGGHLRRNRYYILAHWHNEYRAPTTSIEEIKQYLRVKAKVSKQCRELFIFGWLHPDDVVSACDEHDRLAIKVPS